MIKVNQVYTSFLKSKVIIRKVLEKKLCSSGEAIEKKLPYFITTPIYYVNGDPHLGHAYTSVISDVIARFYRKDNRDVFFLSGTDEHGQKVEQSAKAAGISTLQFASAVSNKFRSLMQDLNCSNDVFIRTTDTKHKESVRELWQQLVANGQIYKGAYEGWYSVRDECFYSERELVNGKAPTGADVELVKEESYFFRLSAYRDRLLQHYAEQPDFIAPKERRDEIVRFVSQEEGLRDLSVSRNTFSWGIPVPGDETHVMYVWLDALANYISALDYPDVSSDRFSRYWPASLHVVGKDILRFHAVYWPAFLMAANLKLPKRIFAHGWWTKDGEKMSKSVGNVVCPLSLVRRFGVDYVRYYLTAEIHTGNDGDFNEALFCSRVNEDLANNLGNLAQRVVVLTGRHCGGKVPPPGELSVGDQQLLRTARNLSSSLHDHVAQQNLRRMCEEVMEVSSLGNKFVITEEPWKLAKTDTARCDTVLYILTELLRCCAVALEPVMPVSCTRLLDQLGIPPEQRSLASLSEIPLAAGLTVGAAEPLFPRVTPLGIVSPTKKKQ